MNESWFFYVHLLDLHGSAKFQLSQSPQEFYDKNFGKNQYERMASCLDIWIGKILEKIDFDNTLLVVTADHGSEDWVFTESMERQKRKVRVIKAISAQKFLSKMGDQE